MGENDLERGLAARLGGSARLAPALADALTGIGGHAEARSPPAAVLAAALARALAQMARERPTLIVVEDVHGATALEMAALIATGEIAHDVRLMVVLTTRSAQLPSLLQLRSLPCVRTIELARLGRGDVTALLAEAAGSDEIADVLGPRLAVRSDGNPFFVLQLLQDFEARHALRRTTGGRLHGEVDLAAVSIPESLRALMEARLDALQEDDRALLEAGAVEGYSFDPDLTWRILGREKLEVLRALGRLARTTGIVRGDGSRFRFDHHQLHEVLTQSLMPALAAEYHRQLAEAWASRDGIDLAGGDVRGDRAAALASHLLAGGDTRRWRPFILRALDHLAARHLTEEALELSSRALDALHDDPRLRAEVALRRAERLELLGIGERLATCEMSLAAAETAGDAALIARCRVELARALYVAGQSERSEPMLRAAVAEEGTEPWLECRARGALGMLFADQGRLEEAEPEYLAALRCARPTKQRTRVLQC